MVLKPLLYEADQLVGYNLINSKRRNTESHYGYEGFRIDPTNEITKDSEFIVYDSVTYGGSYIDDTKLFSYLCKSQDKFICLNNGINHGTMNIQIIENYDISNKIPSKFSCYFTGDERRNFRSFSDTPFWSNSPKAPAAINEVIKFITLRYLIPKLSKSNSNDSFKKNMRNSEIKNNLQRDIAWEELEVYLKKSSYPINLAITPPKKWLINPDENSNEIKNYDDLLKNINELSSIKKVCNLYHYAKRYEHNNL